MLARQFKPLVCVRYGAVVTALWLASGITPAGVNLSGEAVAFAAEQAATQTAAVPTAPSDSSSSDNSSTEKPAAGKPPTDKAVTDKPVTDKSAGETPAPAKPKAELPAAEKPAAEKPKTAVTGIGELGAADRTLLTEILTQAGAASAALHSVERSPERQIAVMLRLAQEDLARAKAMYCAAGDRVLERFDVAASPEKNQAAMLEALLAVLPEAREIGCLNHIRNNDVLSVDVRLADVPEGQRATLVKAAEAAVSAGKIARFLAPPREPDAFHFEFKRRSE